MTVATALPDRWIVPIRTTVHLGQPLGGVQQSDSAHGSSLQRERREKREERREEGERRERRRERERLMGKERERGTSGKE